MADVWEDDALSANIEDHTDFASMMNEVSDYGKYNQIEYFKPYDFQKNFYHLEGYQTPGKHANQRALICANKIGKSMSEAYEVAYHATGRYPDWWKGIRYPHPVNILVASTTNELTRDNCQLELFGEPSDDSYEGTKAIPKSCIGAKTRKPGVPNAFDNVLVKHVTGEYSKISFRAYEQGPKKFMGVQFHHVWADEEPPLDIWSQMLRSTFATRGTIAATFTPEEGMTEVVYAFLEDLKPGQAVLQATWDDAPHMTKEAREQFLQQIPKHERDMRTKGIPMVGTGLIFPVPDENIMIDPFELPLHWPRIVGVDFGWDHPFAAVCLAHDRDQDKFYVYDCFKEANMVIPVAADRVKAMGGVEYPVVWPHDGLIHDRQSGRPLADLFRDKGLNMHPDQFSNPPGPGQKEGQGGQGVEAGLHAMFTAMEEGRFHVFANLDDWFREKRMYHRKDGKVVKKMDDIMSATRYAFMMIRHATTRLPRQQKTHVRRGLRTWA